MTGRADKKEAPAQKRLTVQYKKKKRTGRPSVFTEKLADEICERVGGAESLRSICLDAKMPCLSTVIRWLARGSTESGAEYLKNFCAQYTCAQEVKAETLVDQIGEIHEKAWIPVIVNDVPLIVDGKIVMTVDRASAAVVKLEADNKKWMAEKLAPKKYGARTILQGDKNADPVSVSVSISAVDADL